MLTATASEVDELRDANEAWARWGARAQSDFATMRAERDAARDVADGERAQHLDVVGRCIRAEHDAREATERAARLWRVVEEQRDAIERLDAALARERGRLALLRSEGVILLYAAEPRCSRCLRLLAGGACPVHGDDVVTEPGR